MNSYNLLNLDLFGDLLPHPDVAWHPKWISEAEASTFHEALLAEVAWKQDHISFAGRGPVALPRLTAWQGDTGVDYQYSGIKNVASPWTTTVDLLRQRLQAELGATFNSVLLNQYRSGGDTIGWHADDEPELGPTPVIASLSFGASRMFELRHNTRNNVERYVLESGSLLVMKGTTQQEWKHRVPREPGVVGARINLTFRFCGPR